MAGLFDLIAGDGTSGGLLDFLRNNANAAVRTQTTGAPGDAASYDNTIPPQTLTQAATQPAAPAGPDNSAIQDAIWKAKQAATALTDGVAPAPGPGIGGVPANPTVIAAQPAPGPSIFAPAPAAHTAPDAAQTDAFGRSQAGPLSSGLQNFARVLGNIPRGGMDAPEVITQHNQNQTAQALIKKGVEPSLAAAAVLPGNGPLLTQLIQQAFTSPEQYRTEKDADGNVWQTNVKNGQKSLLLQPKDDAFQTVTVDNADGSKSVKMYNKKTGEWNGEAPGSNQSPGLGDTTKTGQEYLTTLDKPTQDTVKGLLDGTIQPPSSFAASKPYWQQRIAAAKNVDPQWDENLWAERRKMRTDIAGSGNSSMGGIISNGKSSFQHLAELSQSFAGLGNTSSDIPGVSWATNTFNNRLAGGDKIKGKLVAAKDNLMHYGQESTKFYSGTGGGVEEREHALKEVNPATTSGEEQAAYVEKEKNLMLARLREKEAQIRNTMGADYLAKHPVFDAALQGHVDEIDRNIALLRGQKPDEAATKGDSEKATKGKDGTYNVGGSTYKVMEH